MKRCIYCGEVGARTMVLLGFAHKRCVFAWLPKKSAKGKKVRNSLAKEIAREARRKYPVAGERGEGK